MNTELDKNPAQQVHNTGADASNTNGVCGPILHIETIVPEQLNPELVRRLPLEFLKNQRATEFPYQTIDRGRCDCPRYHHWLIADTSNYV